MQDKELLELIKDRDHEAFNQLYNKYWRLVYRWVSNRINDREIVKDLLQNFWIDIWINPSMIKVNELGSAKNILLGFMSFRILDFLKRKNILILNDNTSIEAAIELSYSHVFEDIEIKEVHEIINRILNEMSNLVRDIYLLRERDNYSIQEISQKLQITEETVRRKLALTNKELQAKLSQYYQGEVNSTILLLYAFYFISLY